MATDSSCPVCLPSALPRCFSCWIVICLYQCIELQTQCVWVCFLSVCVCLFSNSFVWEYVALGNRWDEKDRAPPPSVCPQVLSHLCSLKRRLFCDFSGVLGQQCFQRFVCSSPLFPIFLPEWGGKVLQRWDEKDRTPPSSVCPQVLSHLCSLKRRQVTASKDPLYGTSLPTVSNATPHWCNSCFKQGKK